MTKRLAGLTLGLAMVAFVAGCNDRDAQVGGTQGEVDDDDLFNTPVTFVECHYSSGNPWPENWTCADDATVYVDGVLVADAP